MYFHMYTYKHICFHPHMRFDFKTSAAQTTVEFELYLWQSVIDYMCISNLSMNIYYYSELGPSKFGWTSLDLIVPFSTPLY